MAAGLGFKTFTTGEVLTAADVNGYLMQGILVFATEAARNSAITSPQEGQFAFTKDTNSLWYYTGSAWVASGATGDIEGVTAGTGISGGGTSGTVTITNSMATAIDAKGDLVVGTGADAFSRLAVGTNGQVLTADSGEATGLKFATPSASSGPAFRVNRTANYSISQNTWTKVNYNEEDFDTAGNYDPTTNFRFTPTTAGYYQFNYAAQINSATAGAFFMLGLYKNGSLYHNGTAIDITAQTYGMTSSTDLIYMNGSSDYVEVYMYTSSTGANIGGDAAGTVSVFSGVWIRSQYGII